MIEVVEVSRTTREKKSSVLVHSLGIHSVVLCKETKAYLHRNVVILLRPLAINLYS